MGSETAYSPARTVFSVFELRQRILHLLDRSDLARCMRISRESMVDVAADLYKEMKYDDVQYSMGDASAREKMYCNSVIEIDARSITLSPSVLSQLSKGINQYGSISSDQTYRIEQYLKFYHPELLELIIPPLRLKCSRLRKIQFGTQRPTTYMAFWVISLAGVEEDPPGERAKILKEEGIEGEHIDYMVSYTPRVTGLPPDMPPKGSYFSCPLPPKPAWTIRRSFDLYLIPSDILVDGELADKWAKAFKEGEDFDHLNEVIDFSNLPIDLDTITDIYNRQISSGHRPRLSSISALHINPYSISDFQTLAKIAGSSLTSLDLHNCWRQRYSEERTNILFDDLPELTHIIRKYLPNLSKLWIAMSGIEKAEPVCKGMLTSSTLEEVGSISDLRITTARYQGPLFNTIRCLSSITSREAKVWICCENAKGWEPESLSLFLQYLRRQPARIKCHLSAVDFDSLGIGSPGQINEIKYNQDGRPIPLRT